MLKGECAVEVVWRRAVGLGSARLLVEELAYQDVFILESRHLVECPAAW